MLGEPNYSINDLFAQLGLDSSDEAIDNLNLLTEEKLNNVISKERENISNLRVQAQENVSTYDHMFLRFDRCRNVRSMRCTFPDNIMAKTATSY